MSAEKVVALPGDIVMLGSSNKRGRILDWETQLPIDRRQLSASHYAVQPVQADGQNIGTVVFWPQNGIVVVTRHVVPSPRRSLDDIEPFRF